MPTVVLSSGFLAFARHIGVVSAFQKVGLKPTRLSGVSSGSLIGALWASGATPADMLALVDEGPPIRSVALRFPFGRGGPGVFSLDPFVRRIAARLPGRIESLPVPFTVGVVRRSDGATVLLDRGPLAEAIAASCAIPFLFGPRTVDGVSCVDGGAKDRIFLQPLLERAPGSTAFVHLVESSPSRAQRRARIVDDQLAWAASRTALTVVRTPRSGASLFSLGDVRLQVAQAEKATLRALEALESPQRQG